MSNSNQDQKVEIFGYFEQKGKREKTEKCRLFGLPFKSGMIFYI